LFGPLWGMDVPKNFLTGNFTLECFGHFTLLF
jgi:hypothetical protein